jgi:hypothetical protein
MEYANPEIIIPRMLQDYFQEVGFSSLYPNFKTLRIGAVHPFALLLFQESLGQQLDISVFPSITVADSSDTEVFSELGRGYENYMVDSEQLTAMLGQAEAGNLIISDDNISRIKTIIAAGGSISGTKTSYRSQHSVDLNIWSDNKDITSIVYDFVKHFIIGNIQRLHNEVGLDIQNPISGRRSGDINVEFGHILYGANITLSLTIDTASMILDVPVQEVVTILEDPTYHVVGDR